MLLIYDTLHRKRSRNKEKQQNVQQHNIYRSMGDICNVNNIFVLFTTHSFTHSSVYNQAWNGQSNWFLSGTFPPSSSLKKWWISTSLIIVCVSIYRKFLATSLHIKFVKLIDFLCIYYECMFWNRLSVTSKAQWNT